MNFDAESLKKRGKHPTRLFITFMSTGSVYFGKCQHILFWRCAGETETHSAHQTIEFLPNVNGVTDFEPGSQSVDLFRESLRSINDVQAAKLLIFLLKIGNLALQRVKSLFKAEKKFVDLLEKRALPVIK